MILNAIKRMFDTKSPKIKMRGRSGLDYTEGGRIVYLEGEWLPGSEATLVYYIRPNHVWNTPVGEKIDPEAKQRIKNSVEKLFSEKHNMVVEVEIITPT